jgi:hypothetical protein
LVYLGPFSKSSGFKITTVKVVNSVLSDGACHSVEILIHGDHSHTLVWLVGFGGSLDDQLSAIVSCASPEYLCWLRDVRFPFSTLKPMVPERWVLPFFFFKKQELFLVNSQSKLSEQATIL